MRSFIIALCMGILASCGAVATAVTTPTTATTTTYAVTTTVAPTTTVAIPVPATTVAAATTSTVAPTTVALPAAATMLEAWAFCGVHPDAANAANSVRVLAVDAHIDATFGPCMPPDWTAYTTSEPGQRYVDPTMYMRVLTLNASVGMGTIVYDARLWSEDVVLRDSAIAFWSPVMSSITAWDMGDEFDPKFGDWAVLVARMSIMDTYTTPATGVPAYTNHLGMANVVDQAITDLGSDDLSFDAYDMNIAVALTTWASSRTSNLKVAVNALTHSVFEPTAKSVTSAMETLAAAGTDSFLIFGGCYPYASDLSPDVDFGGSSLIDVDGNATPLAAAVFAGAVI